MADEGRTFIGHMSLDQLVFHAKWSASGWAVASVSGCCAHRPCLRQPAIAGVTAIEEAGYTIESGEKFEVKMVAYIGTKWTDAVPFTAVGM